MKRAALVGLAFLAAGCSLLFDPNKVPPRDGGGGGGGGSGGGCTPACRALPNVLSSCDAGQCGYACQSGFADLDGDLADGGGTGCEKSCAGAQPAGSPQAVVATVGDPGTVWLLWPPTIPMPDGWVVCLGSALETCGIAGSSELCAAPLDGGEPLCGAAIDGLPDNFRLQASVTGWSACLGPSSAPPATTSFTPVNPLDAGRIDLDVNGGCTPSLSVPSAGELEVTLGTGCDLVKLKLGDEEWGDATAQVEVYVSTANAAPALAGLGVQATPAGHVVGAGYNFKDADRSTVLGYWPAGNWTPLYGASSVFAPPAGQWVTLQLGVNAGTYSVSTAIGAEDPVERIRWPSPEPDAGQLRGKPGMFVYGQGTVRFRNYRLSTWNQLPPQGPTSVNYSPAGGMLPPAWKVRSQAPGSVAHFAPCPTNPPEATGCAPGSCGPGARGCLRVKRAVLGPGTVLFDLPTGIDVSRSWSYSFRFLATDGGTNAPVVTSGVQNVFGFPDAPLLFSQGADWSGTLRSGSQDLGVTLQPNTWNHVRFSFEPDAGSIGVRLNGALVPGYTRPASWDRHPGALQLGTWGAMELYVTDINISQP